jgi:catechol 2,3-dioxygenase-like lactoylglutathione lyase family enzyme
MGILKLAHYSIRTENLAASHGFYTEVLGLREGYRPPFNFPGHWLYIGEDESDFGVVHLIGVDPSAASGLGEYLGDRAPAEGTGAFDHIAFLVEDWPEIHARCQARCIGFKQRTVPSLNLHQVFILDPSGVTVELNFPACEGAL